MVCLISLSYYLSSDDNDDIFIIIIIGNIQKTKYIHVTIRYCEGIQWQIIKQVVVVVVMLMMMTKTKTMMMTPTNENNEKDNKDGRWKTPKQRRLCTG